MSKSVEDNPTTALEPAAPASSVVETPTSTPVIPSSTTQSAPARGAAGEDAPTPEHAVPAPPVDPKVAQLRAVFPALDVEVVEAVLAASGGNVDSAMDTLLQLNDADYTPDPEELSQLEADEELARQLAQEDEHVQRQQRASATSRSSSLPSQQHPQQPAAYKPYVPKSRRTGPSSPSIGSWQPPTEQPRQQPLEPTRDELEQLTEQFSKFADQGKRLFGNFLSSAKEQLGKVDAMVQRSASPTSSSQAPIPPPKPVHSDSWSIPSPLPRPDGAPQRKATSSAMPDFLSQPSSAAAARSRSPSPSRPTSSSVLPEKPLPSASAEPPSSSSFASASTSAAAPSASTVESPSPAEAFRRPFPMVERNSTGGQKAGGSPAVKSSLGAPTSLKNEEKSHYSLGDDSEDEIDYVRSPFQDDD